MLPSFSSLFIIILAINLNSFIHSRFRCKEEKLSKKKNIYETENEIGAKPRPAAQYRTKIQPNCFALQIEIIMCKGQQRMCQHTFLLSLAI
jgi:hypothetical protein